MSRYLLVSRSPEFERRMLLLFGRELEVLPMDRIGGEPRHLAQIALPRTPAVVILGPLLGFHETRALSAAYLERYPSARILLVHDDGGELEDWVDDMVFHGALQPEAPDELLESAVRSLAGPDDAVPDPVPPSAPAEPLPLGTVGQVVVVASPKGGQGKTTIAVNLAGRLAASAPNSVVLVDADLQFGDVANALDLPVRLTTTELSGTRDELVLKTALPRHPSGFFVLPAPASPESAETVDPGAFAGLLSTLAGIYRWVVVDTAPALGDLTLEAIEHADQAVLVSTATVPALRALFGELAVLRELAILPTRRLVVLNNADRGNGLTVRDASRIAGVDVDVVLPTSSAVPLAVNRGALLIDDDPRDPVARGLRAIGDRIGGSDAALADRRISA